MKKLLSPVVWLIIGTVVLGYPLTMSLFWPVEFGWGESPELLGFAVPFYGGYMLAMIGIGIVTRGEIRGRLTAGIGGSLFLWLLVGWGYGLAHPVFAVVLAAIIALSGAVNSNLGSLFAGKS